MNNTIAILVCCFGCGANFAMWQRSFAAGTFMVSFLICAFIGLGLLSDENGNVL